MTWKVSENLQFNERTQIFSKMYFYHGKKPHGIHAFTAYQIQEFNAAFKKTFHLFLSFHIQGCTIQHYKIYNGCSWQASVRHPVIHLAWNQSLSAYMPIPNQQCISVCFLTEAKNSWLMYCSLIGTLSSHLIRSWKTHRILA